MMQTKRPIHVSPFLLPIVLSCCLVSCARREPVVEPSAEVLDIPTRYPAAQRIVAIGDLHGDLAATRAALRLAGAIDEDDRWAGGTMALVQTGDQLDRGDDEFEILDLLDALTAQARAAGGVLPHVVDFGIERLNQETRAWIRRERPYPPDILLASDGPVWSRHYSDEPDGEDCDILEQTLDRLGARRMVVGHTVNRDGISSACGGQVWRIDVGMARHYGGNPAVLELRYGVATIID